MSLYETGTITGALNATTITGTGTKWSDAKIGITNGSVLFASSAAGIEGVYQIKRVINDTSIELSQPIYKAFTNSKYSILVAEASSTASFANQLAATLGYYQAQIEGWQQIMTGTGDVELTAPDGTKVTIKSFTALDKNKADVKDIEKLEKDKMSVGAFGLGMVKGAAYIKDEVIGNGHTLENGFYVSNGDYIGRPAGIGSGQFLGVISMNMTDTDLYKAQIATSYSQKGRMFLRTAINGVNNDWFEVALLQNGVNTRTFDGDLRINNIATGVSLVLVNPKATEATHDKWFYFSMGGTNQQSYMWVTKATNIGYGINWPQSGGTIALVGTSDERYKKEIKSYDGVESVSKINEMNLITFIYKDDDKERVRRGVSAQQLQEIDNQYVKVSSEIIPEFDEEKNIINSTSKEKLVLDNNVIMMDMLANIKFLNNIVESQAIAIKELKESITQVTKE